MSLTLAIVLIVLLDLAILAGLAAVALIPFRLDRRASTPAAAVHRLGSADLLESKEAAA